MTATIAEADLELAWTRLPPGPELGVHLAMTDWASLPDRELVAALEAADRQTPGRKARNCARSPSWHAVAGDRTICPTPTPTAASPAKSPSRSPSPTGRPKNWCGSPKPCPTGSPPPGRHSSTATSTTTAPNHVQRPQLPGPRFRLASATAASHASMSAGPDDARCWQVRRGRGSLCPQPTSARRRTREARPGASRESA
jgi:hypothetical protein